MKNLFGEEEPKEVWAEESPTVFRVDSLGSSTRIVDMTEDEKARLLLNMVRASDQIYENTCGKIMSTTDVSSCGACGGEGVVDSGGQNPDGSWINIPCPYCNQKPRPIAINKPLVLLSI